MTYFTSWDANVFLCLLSVFPEEVVRGMIKTVKNTHEEHVLLETVNFRCQLAPHILFKSKMLWPPLVTQELKAKWKWRCPERRRKNVVNWTFSEYDYIRRHFWDNGPTQYPGKGFSRKGYWNSGEAWSYSINEEDIYEGPDYDSEGELTMDTGFDNNTWERHRRLYVSQWYSNIHEGRYFLFFKENDIFSTDLYDKYRNEEKATVSIAYIGCRAQVAQDLLTIDGPGLGESPGSKVEHIDDLFS